MDGFEPAIRGLLLGTPTMPATVIAERIGWTRSSSILRARVAQLRPLFVPLDPASRTSYDAGELMQCDLWFPAVDIALGHGQVGRPPVLVMVTGYSRMISAVMIPSRKAPDLIAGHWAILQTLGVVPRALVWDNEGAVGSWHGGRPKLAEDFEAFRGVLGIKVIQCRPRDPEAKGIVERANGYLETSFLPGRSFTSPADFNTKAASAKVSGEASTVVLPCGSTRESRCPTCARRARVLRMHQCSEGWHLADELPDLQPSYDDSDDAEPQDDGQGSGRVVRSTRRRSDAADLPVRSMDDRTVGRSFTAADGKTYRPSMFVTLTLPSYGRIVRGQGVPVDPNRYDYRRAALDAMHFSKLVDRWVQNLRRGAGFKVQYFAAIEPQRRLAPHVHVAMRGAIPRAVIGQVTRGTYFQLWWPSFDVPLYVHRSPVFLDGAYRDPDTGQELKTWAEATAELEQNPDARPAHVMRLGAQVDVKGILAGSKDANRTVGYLTKYLAKSMSAPMGDGQESGSAGAAHHDRLAREVRWLPCTPGCGNWLRYGIQPKDAGPGLVAGSCPSKAHDAEHLGLGGRRVLVSRKWTGKTLDVHRADRAAVVRQVLEEAGVQVAATDRCAADVLAPDGQPRFVWSVLPPGEGGYNAAVFAQILQRRTWRAQYDAAKRPTGRAGPPLDNLSATHPPTDNAA